MAKITKSVRREADGRWTATVWFGNATNPTNVRRYIYLTRQMARRANISDVGGAMRANHARAKLAQSL